MPKPATSKAPPRKQYRPYAKQLHFHQSTTRFKVVCAGRRSGKTYAAVQEVFKLCVENPNSYVWWIAPINETSNRGLDTLLEVYPESSPEYQKYIRKIRQSPPKVLHFKNGSRVDFKSAEYHRSLVGAGLDLVVLDEAAFIADEIWYRALRPTLSDKGGRAILISTPDRKNFFYDLYQRGLDANQKDYESFHWTSADNVYIKNVEEEIEQARQDLSEEEFRNLYLAEFLEEDSQVFKGIKNCIRERDVVQTASNRWWTEEKSDGKRAYTMGVDVAKSGRDFTVITVTKYIRNETKWEKRVVYLERINEDSLRIQAQRIYEVWCQFGDPKTYIDATSIGSALVDELSRHPTNIPEYQLKPIVFDGKNKGEIIGRVKADIEHRRITFPNIPVLLNELGTYERIYNAGTGHIKYSAPGRKHDDCVVSLALATMKENTVGQRVFADDTRTLLGF